MILKRINERKKRNKIEKEHIEEAFTMKDLSSFSKFIKGCCKDSLSHTILDPFKSYVSARVSFIYTH